MASRFDRRTFLGHGARTAAGLAVVGGAGSVLAACGGSGGKGGSSQNRGGTGVGKPVLGGSLTFGAEAEESGFDPTNAHFDSTGVLYARTVYDPLAIPLADGTIVPYLAQSISHNSTYTEWTITLRPNLVFHDGSTCDGSALLFCMQQYKASPLVNFTLTYMESVSQTNDLAVTVKMNRPWVHFDAWLAGYIGGQMAYVFSPSQWKKPGAASGLTLLNSHPIGTGPFVFQEWVANSHFTATKNPHYWRKDKYGNQLPYLDSITFKPIPIASDRLQDLKSGALDIIHTDDPSSILAVRSDADLYNVEDVDSPVEHDMDFGMINTTKAPFDDVRVRQAFACAFNQTNYLAVDGLGVDKPSSGPFSPGSPYYAPTGYPTYDVAKGRSLLQSYMHDHGLTSLTVQYGTTETPESVAAAALIAQYFKAIGGTVDVTQVEQSAYITDAVFGEFYVFAWRQFANIDPDLNYVFWSSEAPTSGISVDFTRLQDPTVQKNIDRGRQTTDQEERIECYQNVAKQFGVQCPYIWASEDVWAIGAHTTVQNFDHPTAPDGRAALGMLSGIIWPTEIWKTASA